MSESTNKPSVGFWVISVIALIWNLMGVLAYITQVNRSDEIIAALPEVENVPIWVTGAFAIAVFGGTLGCVLLLLRKKMASIVFIVSLLGIIAQMTYNFMLNKTAEVYDSGGMIMPAMVVFFGAFLVWYTKQATAKGWLS